MGPVRRLLAVVGLVAVAISGRVGNACTPDVGANYFGGIGSGYPGMGVCTCTGGNGSWSSCDGILEAIVTVDKGCKGSCTACNTTCRRLDTIFWVPAGEQRGCRGDFALDCNQPGACYASPDWEPLEGEVGIRDCQCR